MQMAIAMAKIIKDNNKVNFSKESVIDLLNEIADGQESEINLLKKKQEFFNNDIGRLVNKLKFIDSKFKELSGVNNILREQTKKKQHNGDKQVKAYIFQIVNAAKENDKRISVEICELFKILLGNCYQCPFYDCDSDEGCVHGGFSIKTGEA